MFTCVSKNLSTLTRTVKALLIILPKRSLIECNGKQKSVKMQPRKVTKFKPHGAPKRLGAPGELPPVPPPPFSVGLVTANSLAVT